MNHHNGLSKQMNSPWKFVSLSTYASIKGLIKFRFRFDKIRQSNAPTRLKNALYYPSYVDEDIVCTYIWLDDIIDKCEFNELQQDILNMYMSGYTESDIAYYTSYTQQNIHKTLNRICRKIYKVNYQEWYYNNLCLNHINAPFEYKKCSSCHKILPLTKDFYDVATANKDGFRGTCKKCRKEQNI